MHVGIIGTGAIAHMHAKAYRNIGFELVCDADVSKPHGEKFADEYNCKFVGSYEEVCTHPKVDYIDVCTFPDFRLQPVELAAKNGKHIQVQKPMAIDTATARKMIDIANAAGVKLSVVSQHRFDDSMQFLDKAIAAGRLGKLLQADAYVKWYRSEEYYSRPIKGSWAVEGGGALINQAIHQVDMLRWIAGPVAELMGFWQLHALHKIESEDVMTAILKYANGATGVIQASTAFWPGYGERIELHGTKGTAIITGDKLTTWDVKDDEGEPAPVAQDVASGSSDPMAISLAPFERQFLDFADAIRNNREPKCSAAAGYAALELVERIYASCRSGEKQVLA